MNFMLECQQQAATLKQDLYEGDDDFKQMLIDLNKHGFLTTTSQPG